jgi:hypothetical protein
VGEQCQHAHFQDAFFELDLQGFNHALLSITRYLALQDTTHFPHSRLSLSLGRLKKRELGPGGRCGHFKGAWR